jgi:hypothetical protein
VVATEVIPASHASLVEEGGVATLTLREEEGGLTGTRRDRETN